MCVCVRVCIQLPSVWLPGAGSGGPGLSAPSQSSSGSATSSPALLSGLPAGGLGSAAGCCSPPASPRLEQQAWVRMGLQQGAEQQVKASRGQNMTDILGNPGKKR